MPKNFVFEMTRIRDTKHKAFFEVEEDQKLTASVASIYMLKSAAKDQQRIKVTIEFVK